MGTNKGGGAYLFLSEPRSKPNNIYYITLHDAYIRELTASKGI